MYHKNIDLKDFKTPLVTVIMPVYNGAEFIDESVKSVIEQTHTNWELIIVDDGSDDESLKRIECWADKDSRIKAFQHPGGVNKGVSATRNLAISKAEGKFMAMLDCDDVWYPQKLEKQINIITENPDVVLIYNKSEGIDEYGALINNRKIKLPQLAVGVPGKLLDPFRKIMVKDFVVPTSSTFFIKKISEECGNFDETTGDVEDTLLWYQITEKGNIYFIDEVLSKYRFHEESWNAKNIDLKLLIGRRLLLYSKLIKVVKPSNKKIVSYKSIDVGFRIIVRNFLLYPKMDLIFIGQSLKKIWKNQNILLIHKIFSVYVLLIETIKVPFRPFNLLKNI